MLLPFSQQLNGVQTHFEYKIWNSLLEHRISTYSECNKYQKKRLQKLQSYWSLPTVTTDLRPRVKKHTIRKDENDRYKVGVKLHFYINNRTKKAFNFAPVVPIISIQKIQIFWLNQSPAVYVDGRMLLCFEIKRLAWNDGFDSEVEFFNYFNEDFTGKIIHWTKTTY